MMEEQSIKPAFSENSLAVYMVTDNAYAPYLGTAVYSFLCHASKNRNYDIIICENGLSQENKNKFYGLVKQKDNCSIRFFDMQECLKQLKVHSAEHISINSYAKIFVMSDLFSQYDRVLLLDSDILVIDDISGADKFDLGEYPVAAVRDPYMEILVKRGFHADKRLAYRPLRECYRDKDLDLSHYFNAGVMLFDLQKCRAGNYYHITLDLCNQNPVLVYMDQDILNMVFKNHWKELDFRWNGMSPYSFVPEKGDLPENYEQRLRNGNIIHFVGGNKPWQDKNALFASEYMEYASASPWKAEVEESRIRFGEAGRVKAFFLPKGSRRRKWFYKLFYKWKELGLRKNG